MLKEYYPSIPGIIIEKTVLGIQQRNKGIYLDDIIKEAGKELWKSWSELANETEKDITEAANRGSL